MANLKISDYKNTLKPNAQFFKTFGYDSSSKVPEAPPIPINPVNEKLNDIHSQYKSDSSKKSQSEKRWNFIMLLFALLSLVTATFFSVLSYVSSNQSSAKLEKIILEKNVLLRENLASKRFNENNSVETKVVIKPKEQSIEK
ncbi:hypothetical protein [Pseudoalteromonas sp. SWYJZ12]|uniref:hypothetical protein n=1 Tax=Pseudoalteromonas sp. SWYJZ12 TaxID=2792067 RepID=UPI0018CF738F|nr:hypothetical protein [Pseudoalteromonas sp. SWYJZ12]MBH0002942.1 hypothetical protein [Pseudoalteromonas sp. SWYJZ12]